MVTIIINSMEGPLQLLLARTAENRSFQSCASVCAEGGNALEYAFRTTASALIDSLCWEPDGQGAETLIPNLAELLQKNGIKNSEVRRIACVRGPGSFTGIRLALSTALGLSRSMPGKPELGGIDYLPLLAHTALTALDLPQAGNLWTLTHARRGQVHIQGFNLETELSPLCAARGCLLKNAAEIIDNGGDGAAVHPDTNRAKKGCADNVQEGGQPAQHPSPLYLMGSGLARNREFFATCFPHAHLLDEPLFPSVPCLLGAAAGAEYSRKPVEPLYLRASDAEENLPYIAAGLGLDPHQAMLDLLKLTGRMG
ncbi:MAG: tRNA (adenosine(37)-N6)-threonylcarbamoyltransferase complex dimerization subunit type 1 TsaB [Desulfovibrionaceae bacterium]|nr:tRNA (adenosine(37)-N6)-threonylcarbamoyltransferase complex dimerization subunit type 1 TsaB [Desulfovibrionaceae bacterium]